MAILPEPVLTVANGVLLLLVLIGAIVIARAAMQYNWHYGDGEKQFPLTRRILKVIVLLISVGLVAILLNFFG